MRTHIGLCAEITAGIIAFSSRASAAENPGPEEVFVLGRIEIAGDVGTADRLDAEQIRQHDRKTVGEAASLLPGVSLSKVGARNEQMVYVRGFDLRQVPLFVDGVPVYVPYDGYVDLGRFLTYDLAEIDVAKGFSSVIYGPNTLGGAINLVTRRPTDVLELDAHAGLSSGEHADTLGQRAWLNLGTRQGNWYGQLSGSYAQSDAYALPGDFSPVATENGGARENSYQEDSKASAKLGFMPNAGDEYALGYVYQHGRKGTPPYAGQVAGVSARYWQWPYWDKQSLYASTRARLASAGTLSTRLYYERFKNALFSYDNATYTTITRSYAFRSWYDDPGYGASVVYELPQLGIHHVRAAAHLKHDEHTEHNAGEPERHFRDRTSSYGIEDTLQFTPSLSGVVGIAYDQRKSLRAENYNSNTRAISDFPDNQGSSWNPQAGLFFEHSSGHWRLTAARKSRFPTIKDRYSYRLGQAIPNPDLEQESATHYELGYRAPSLDRFTVSAAVFYTRVRNLIQQVTISPGTYQMQNVGRVRNRGVELAAAYNPLDTLTLDVNYTWLQRDNLSNPDILLTDVPRQKFFGHVRWQAGEALTLQASARAETARESASNGTQPVGGFTVFDIKGGYRFAPQLSIDAAVDNVGDKLYAISEGYPEAGRTYSLTLNYAL